MEDKKDWIDEILVFLKHFEILLFFAGFIFLFFGIYQVVDIKKLQIQAYTTPIFLSIIIGVILIIIAIILECRNRLFGSIPHAKIKKEKSKLSFKVKETEINLHYGKIEDIYNSSCADSLLVLPTNEFFDKECFNDKHSALGSFMQNRFKEVNEIIKLVEHDLLDKKSKLVEKEKGKKQNSYDIGESVYLDNPLNSKDKILIIAVAQKRKGTGLCAEISYIYKAINIICEFMADNRIQEVYCPILCAGHGGINDEMALFSMLSAFSEKIQKKITGNNIKKVNIVIYVGDSKAKPKLSKSTSIRIIEMSHQIS